MKVEELRSKEVNHIENYPNFQNINEIEFNFSKEKLKAFKEKHSHRGTFTDDSGILVLATSFLLDVTIQIVSQTNTVKLPYTTYNPGRIKYFISSMTSGLSEQNIFNH